MDCLHIDESSLTEEIRMQSQGSQVSDDSAIPDLGQFHQGGGPGGDGIKSRRINQLEQGLLDTECLNELENILVPETIVLTNESSKSKVKTDAGQIIKRKARVRKRNGAEPSEILSKAGSNHKSQSQRSLFPPESMKFANLENGREEEEEDDEFEDEGELEEGNKFGDKPDPERERRRPPVLMPMPAMKRASLCLKEKVAIIKDLENGEKQSSICKQKRLPKSTVQSIWKNRTKILEASEKIGLGRKRCRRAQHENIEDKLVEWIETLKSQNVPVNGPQLRAKAQVFAKQLGISEFRSSTGWLDKFKTRHNIALKKSAKGSLSSSSATDAAVRKVAIEWVTKVWPNVCEGYAPENIFNADEFGLFYNALPDMTNRLANETCHGGRMAQDRLTVLLCANSDGTEKRPLTIVGNLNLVPPSTANLKNLPVNYVIDSKSWLTRFVFVEELRRWDEELGEAGRSILVILDTSPAHTVTETFSNIKLVFLPPTVAATLQPLERGVIDSVKIQYRRLLLDKLVRKCQSLSQDQIVKVDDLVISVWEAIFMLDTAWASVTSESILECFKNSNLQSINVSNSCSSTSRRFEKTDTDVLLDAELMDKLILYAPILHIPTSMNLGLYNQIDSKLHVTDYINDELHYKPAEEPIQNLTIPPVDLPSKFEVQEYLSSIRNWVMALPTDSDARLIHQSVSILENFALRQAETDNNNEHLLQSNQQTPMSSSYSLPSPSTHQNIQPNNNAAALNRRSQSQTSVGRVMFNGSLSLNNNVTVNQHPSVLTIPSTHNNSTNSNATTVVTFALADSLTQPLSHHLMDQQQFFAYLT